MIERQRDRVSRDKKTLSVLSVSAVLLLSALTGMLFVTAVSSSSSGGTHTVPIFTFDGASCTVTVWSETMKDNAIQSAIATYGPLSSPGTPVTICIGPGTFPEQLTINDTTDLSLVGSGNSSTFLAPTSLVPNGVELDQLFPAYAVIGAWDDVGLTIANLAVAPTSAAATSVPGCGDAFLGIYFGGTSGTVTGTSVTGVNQGGCQDSSAVLLNTGYYETSIVTPEAATIVGNTVSGYGKNAITCDDLGVSCVVEDNTVSSTAMPLGLSATNGIQFYGATGTISSNSVSGNVYLPGACLDQNYFSSGVGCVSPYWASGILIFDAPSTVTVLGNALSNNQVSIWSLGAPTDVESNTITEWGYYGIVLDYNYYDAGGASALTYSGAGVGTATNNMVLDQNVGILAFDDNSTITGNTFSSVNVSVEAAVNISVPSTNIVSDNVGDVNVSGALLGNISSFQDGVGSLPTSAFTVDGNAFTNASGPGSMAQGSGISLNGASGDIEDNEITGFPMGISAVVSASGSVTADDNTVVAPTPAIPGWGIYLFAGSATVQGNSVSGFSWMNGPAWWPDSQAAGLFVQCLGTATLSENVLYGNALGMALSSYGYGPFPAPGWPYVAPPSAGPIAISDNTVTDSGAFGIALELNQFTSSETAAPSVSITGNTVDNTLSGAVGLMVDQGTYTITGNTFIGTSLTGSSGASQPTGAGSIGTASIQVLDVSDSATLAYVGSNSYLDTSLTVAVLNLTTLPPYFAGVVGLPPLATPATPSVSATALDVDQSLTVTGSIPTGSGVPFFSWTWLVSVNGGIAGLATQCTPDSGVGVAGGTPVSCTVASGTLTPGSIYAFELQVTDSATPPITATSAASATVSVASALTIPGTPSVSATALDGDQALTVTGTIPTTGTSPYSWTWLVSVSGGSYGTATECPYPTGTGSGGATLTCTIPGGTLSSGTYAFELQVTDGATVPQTETSFASSTVSVSSALAAPTQPVVSATALDVNQALTVTGTIPSTGTPSYAWQWLVSVNGGGYVPSTQCVTNGGTGAAGGAGVTCSIGANKLAVSSTYAFELEVTDSATVAQTKTSGASSTVTVSSALTAPGRPTVNRPALDVNQALTVTGTIPTTGSPSFSWTWLVSVNGGTYGSTTQCAVNGGTGALAGVTEMCSVPAGTLTAGNYYNFKLVVSDSATSAETKTSAPSKTVTVSSALAAPAAPGVSATKLDVDQPLTVTGTIPSTGTAPYGWEWLLSVNGGAYALASDCGTPSGSGASAGMVVTCSIPGNTLTVGDHYTFKLKVGDSATTVETLTSAPSKKVTVTSKLTAPGAPTVSATTLPVTHALTVTGKVPTTGAAPYSWQWQISVNGGGFVPASQCSVNSGTGAAAGAKLTCAVPANTLTVGDTYAFELMVMDGATLPESQTSVASPTVTVIV